MSEPADFDRRALLAVMGASLAVASCSNIIGPPDAPPIYKLLPAFGELPGGKVNWALAVGRPDSTHSIDTNRIAISRSTDTLDYYADATWPDKLPDLIQSALIDGFEKSGRIDQVASDTGGIRSDYLLQTEIRSFEARYDQPDAAPVAVVRIEARLIARDQHTIVARMVAEHEAPASQNTIDAAVDGLETAFTNVATQIVSWTLTAAPIESEATPHRKRSGR